MNNIQSFKKGGGEVGGSTLNTQSTGKSDLFVGAQPLRHHSAVSAKSRRPVLRDRYNNHNAGKVTCTQSHINLSEGVKGNFGKFGGSEILNQTQILLYTCRD